MTSNMGRDQRQPSITGRDNYIILKALAYAIKTIRNLPASRQERADMKDMECLLLYWTRDFPVFLDEAEAHINVVALHQPLDRPT